MLQPKGANEIANKFIKRTLNSMNFYRVQPKWSNRQKQNAVDTQI